MTSSNDRGPMSWPTGASCWLQHGKHRHWDGLEPTNVPWAAVWHCTAGTKPFKGQETLCKKHCVCQSFINLCALQTMGQKEQHPSGACSSKAGRPGSLLHTPQCFRLPRKPQVCCNQNVTFVFLSPVPGNVMTLKFLSDASVTAGGFQIRYVTIDVPSKAGDGKNTTSQGKANFLSGKFGIMWAE